MIVGENLQSQARFHLGMLVRIPEARDGPSLLPVMPSRRDRRVLLWVKEVEVCCVVGVARPSGCCFPGLVMLLLLGG